MDQQPNAEVAEQEEDNEEEPYEIFQNIPDVKPIIGIAEKIIPKYRHYGCVGSQLPEQPQMVAQIADNAQMVAQIATVQPGMCQISPLSVPLTAKKDLELVEEISKAIEDIFKDQDKEVGKDKLTELETELTRIKNKYGENIDSLLRKIEQKDKLKMKIAYNRNTNNIAISCNINDVVVTVNFNVTKNEHQVSVKLLETRQLKDDLINVNADGVEFEQIEAMVTNINDFLQNNTSLHDLTKMDDIIFILSQLISQLLSDLLL